MDEDAQIARTIELAAANAEEGGRPFGRSATAECPGVSAPAGAPGGRGPAPAGGHGSPAAAGRAPSAASLFDPPTKSAGERSG